MLKYFLKNTYFEFQVITKCSPKMWFISIPKERIEKGCYKNCLHLGSICISWG